MNEIIKILDLKKYFNKNIAVDVSFLSIYKKELIGIVGNNGAGKTTLFRLLLDLLKADRGNALLFGENVFQNEDWKMQTGSYIDESFLIQNLYPEEYFSFIGTAYRIKESDLEHRLSIYSDLMNGEILKQNKYIRNFSAGNKQKIGIIGAMIVQPQILVLDEPFNFLDPSSQKEMKRLLKWINEEFGTTVLVSSHNLNHIVDVSDRILLMERGSIIQDHNNTDHEKNIIAELEIYFDKAKPVS